MRRWASVQTAVTAAESKRELAERVFERRMVNREVIRRQVLREGRIDVLARVLGYELTAFHKCMLDFHMRHLETLQLAARQFGKSAMITITRAVYEIIRDPNVRLLIASNTQLQAERFLSEIKQHFEHNERLRECFGDYMRDADKWDAREIIVAGRTRIAKESTVTCVGYGGPAASRG